MAGRWFWLALEALFMGNRELIELVENYLDLSTRLDLVRGWLDSARPVRASF